MKIREVTHEYHPKISALLRRAFPGSNYEMQVVENLHKNGKEMHEWVAIHTNKLIAYIAFSHAFKGEVVCGLHLAPFAVNPEFQGQGIGSELLRFALRQEAIKDKTIFVLGKPGFYNKFGFSPCAQPLCPFDTNNTHFLSIRNDISDRFTVGYEKEFGTANSNKRPARQSAKRKRKK